MTFSLPLLIIGLGGFVVFILTGALDAIPWVASGPFALAFLGLMIAEFREYFQTVKPKPAPKNVYTNEVGIEGEKSDSTLSKKLAKLAAEKEPERKSRPKAVPLSADNSPLEETVQMVAKSSIEYPISLKMGETLHASVGADDWIGVELRNKSDDVVRNRDGKNINIEFEAERNGNWTLYIFNQNKSSLKVGVTLSVE